MNLWSVDLSRRKLVSSTMIKSANDGEWSCKNGINSSKNTEVVSLFFLDGAGLYTAHACHDLDPVLNIILKCSKLSATFSDEFQETVMLTLWRMATQSEPLLPLHGVLYSLYPDVRDFSCTLLPKCSHHVQWEQHKFYLSYFMQTAHLTHIQQGQIHSGCWCYLKGHTD